MPYYIYKCKECELTLEVKHAMAETIEDCPHCKVEKVLFKIPLMSKSFKEGPNSTPRVGALVDEYITSTKKEVKEEKKRLKQEGI